MKIIPAILTNKIKDLEDKLKKLSGLVDLIQIDIIDGNFINNKTIGLKDLKKIKLLKNFKLEAHLMVKNPEKYFEDCQKLGIKRVIFHIEAVKNLKEILETANKFKFEIGVALNPKTNIEKIKPYLNRLNLILLMGVNPGFQGQKFIPSVLNKIKTIKKVAPKIKIEVDGGINENNIKKVAYAGADYLIIGSSLWKSENIKKQLSKLKKQAT